MKELLRFLNWAPTSIRITKTRGWFNIKVFCLSTLLLYPTSTTCILLPGKEVAQFVLPTGGRYSSLRGDRAPFPLSLPLETSSRPTQCALQSLGGETGCWVSHCSSHFQVSKSLSCERRERANELDFTPGEPKSFHGNSHSAVLGQGLNSMYRAVLFWSVQLHW